MQARVDHPNHRASGTRGIRPLPCPTLPCPTLPCPMVLRPVLVCAMLLLVACDDKPSGKPVTAVPSTSSSIGTVASVAASSTASSGRATKEAPSVALELQELTFTSEVKAKEPVDVLLAAEPGKRVWAHLRLRNRGEGPRKIHLVFRVNGDKRTTLDLKVAKSWSYRTWAYNTLLDTDKKGEVSLEVTDDQGTVLAKTSVPIAGKARTKPYPKKRK